MVTNTGMKVPAKNTSMDNRGIVPRTNRGRYPQWRTSPFINGNKTVTLKRLKEVREYDWTLRMAKLLIANQWLFQS
jgi:hypothetical protein